METPGSADEPLEVMGNLGHIYPGIYRSEYPKAKHLRFLKGLRLRTVLTFIEEAYDPVVEDFYFKEDIQLIQIGMNGNKEPFTDIPERGVVRCLTELLDKRNHPMLIHCNKGKHRTGCVVGILRRLCGWNFVPAYVEYIRYSHPKERLMDELFIEAFDISKVPLRLKHLPDWFWKSRSMSDVRRVRKASSPSLGSISSAREIIQDPRQRLRERHASLSGTVYSDSSLLLFTQSNSQMLDQYGDDDSEEPNTTQLDDDLDDLVNLPSWQTSLS